jgi:hypothetical protein
LAEENVGPADQRHQRTGALYGIPFSGATINLPDVVRALHRLPGCQRRELSTDDDLFGSGFVSRLIWRWRQRRFAGDESVGGRQGIEATCRADGF